MIIAVIPCHNEANTIADVVQRARSWVDCVIVIDNMSDDYNTAANAISAGASDVQRCYIRGAGAATRFGIACALNQRQKADVIVTCDGDGQHDPDEIPFLIAPIVSGIADMVIGSRAMNGTMPAYRKLGISIINLATNLGASIQFTDSQCCFRAYSRDAAMVLNQQMRDNGFGFSTEALIRARAMKMRIMSVPVKTIYHDLKQDSAMNPIKHGLSVLMKTIKWRLRVEYYGRKEYCLQHAQIRN